MNPKTVTQRKLNMIIALLAVLVLLILALQAKEARAEVQPATVTQAGYAAPTPVARPQQPTRPERWTVDQNTIEYGTCKKQGRATGNCRRFYPIRGTPFKPSW